MRYAAQLSRTERAIIALRTCCLAYPPLTENPCAASWQPAGTEFYRCHAPRWFPGPRTASDLNDLARDVSAAHRLARRANALVSLDQGIQGAVAGR
jgi:hypothetical protein